MKKSSLILLIVLALGISAYIFRADLTALKNVGQKIAKDPGVDSLTRDLNTLADKVFTSTPLRFNGGSSQAKLTIAGVIKDTNRERQNGGLKTLKESAKLDRAAQLKVDDMFKLQYFEHESPSGQGPGDLATKVGYAYLMVGENLALGNFLNDDALVAGWMASPGHRENIMRPGYTEIGVAVRQGLFNGKMTWLAVQEFGTPASVCPLVDQKLAAQIEADRKELARQETILEQKKQELDAYEPKRGSEYETKVSEYNALVEKYNKLVSDTKVRVQIYNRQVAAHNDCLKKLSG